MACTNASVGFEPDVISYNSVIDACARAGNATRSKGWFNCMENDGVHPNVRASFPFLHVCANEGNILRAEMWLNRVDTAGFSSRTLFAPTLCFTRVRSRTIAIGRSIGTRICCVAVRGYQSIATVP